jgi:hypothetical protein
LARPGGAGVQKPPPTQPRGIVASGVARNQAASERQISRIKKKHTFPWS